MIGTSIGGIRWREVDVSAPLHQPLAVFSFCAYDGGMFLPP